MCQGYALFQSFNAYSKGYVFHQFSVDDAYEICAALGIKIRYKDLGTDIKAYYICPSRIRNIVLNRDGAQQAQHGRARHVPIVPSVCKLNGFLWLGECDATAGDVLHEVSSDSHGEYDARR